MQLFEQSIAIDFALITLLHYFAEIEVCSREALEPFYSFKRIVHSKHDCGTD